MLAAYLERNAMIECQIGTENTTGTLNVDEASAFARTLNEKYFTRLNDAAETLRAVTSAIYEQNTFAQFASRNVERSGEIGVSLVSVAVFVVVFLVGTIGVCVRQYHKKQADDSFVTMTAYEVSISKLALYDEFSLFDIEEEFALFTRPHAEHRHADKL